MHVVDDIDFASLKTCVGGHLSVDKRLGGLMRPSDVRGSLSQIREAAEPSK